MTDAATTPPTPESLLPDLKKELGAECEGVTDEHLMMFLHWKPSVKRAAGRFRDFVKWRADSEGIFDESLRASKDPELERLLLSEVIVAPPNCTTKVGGPVLIGRFRNNDMTDGRTADGVVRMMFYTIDRVLQRQNTQEHGVTVVHDLRGFDKSKNARLDIAKRLFKGFLGQFPIQVKAIYVCQAPLPFIMFFKVVSLFMPGKLKERVNFIDDFSELDTKYGVMDPKNLLPEMGGTLEWSAKEWVEAQKLAEESGDFKTLTTLG